MENKSSKILIVVGIAIAIVGGIVFMNAFTNTSQNKKDNPDDNYHDLREMAQKQKEMTHLAEPQINPFLSPSVIVMLGIGLIALGFFTGQPRHNKNLPPGIG